MQMHITTYLQSEDCKRYIEALKRKERERILKEVQEELEREKAMLLEDERKKMRALVEEEMSKERLLIENKVKIQEHERKQYEIRMKEDEERLLMLQRKAQVLFCHFV
jgi:gamma-glutamyl phosphate reductase